MAERTRPAPEIGELIEFFSGDPPALLREHFEQNREEYLRLFKEWEDSLPDWLRDLADDEPFEVVADFDPE
jgi:hypothetical protein